MLKLIERGFFKSPAIKLGENGRSPDVQVLRVGKFKHPKYGAFEITKALLAEMKTNFDNRVRGIDIAFDYFHDSDKDASGWPTKLYLNEDGSELWANVDWTPTALKKLGEREIRYFSPDFAFVWKDPESGVTYNNVLFGGGLTNRPFVKDMAAIVASENKQGGFKMTLEELAAQVAKLSEANAEQAKKLAEYAPKTPDPADADTIEGLKKKLGEMEVKCAEQAKQLDELAKAKALTEKEASFNVMLSEGKACAAQKDAFMKDDFNAFVKLASPVNLAPKGDAGGSAEGGDRDDKVLKLAEAKTKADPKLSLVDAISQANKEIAK